MKIFVGYLSKFFIVFLLPLSVAYAGQLYRYENDEGVMVMTYTLPPHIAKRGYTIINERGQVIKEVPRELTEEELAEVESEKQQQEKLAVIRKEQQERDKQLLRSFSHAEDAERAMERKLAALDVIIDITRGTISQLNIELESDQLRAANIERGGGTVPEGIMENIADIERQIEDAEDFIQEKEDEKQQVRNRYGADIARLKELGR